MLLTGTHPGLAAADRPRADGAGLLVAAQNLGHAAVGHAQLAGDDARPDPVVRHLHDLVPNVVGERPAVDEDAAKLVDPTLAQRSGDWGVPGKDMVITNKSIQKGISNKILV